MLIEQRSSAIKIINDFSRQLFLIKTPSDFNKGLNGALNNAFPGINLYVFFKYHWESDTFSVISSNFIKDIDEIPLNRSNLDEQLNQFIKRDQVLYNKNILEQRDGEILPLLNTSTFGSEVMIPLTPVNDAVGILYAFAKNVNFFDGEHIDTIQLIGNMTSRAWNLVNYQAHQIKSHKRAELEVINQKNLMNEIFNYLPINIFTKDEAGKFIYVNKNAEESFGIKSENAINKTVYDLYSKAEAEKLELDDNEVRKTKKPKISQVELEISGRKRHYYIGKKIIKTSENKELLIGFSVDVTQNIQASKTIEDQKKFYQQIFNTVPNYIYLKDKNGKFLLVNEAVSELFGLSQEQIFLNGIINSSKYKIDKKLNFEIDQKVIKAGETIEYEESIVVNNGEDRWYHTIKKPLPDKNGNINVLGISMDITNRKKHSDELIKAKHTKEQFLANMSHEIRTPINGIVGMVNLLEEIPATEEQKKYLHAIKISSKNLQVIINDILDLSAVESGNIKFERIGFNLKSFFNTLISSFNYAAKQKGLSITLNFDPYIDEVVIGDPVRLNQVISNLIGNAVKFTKRGYVKVYALKISEENNLGHFQFIVDDSGMGIPEDKMQKVFENFEQGDVAINRKYGGTGLGLAIVKQLVENQDGTIKAQSKLGRGTKFTVNLTLEIGKEDDLDETKSPTSAIKTANVEIDLAKHKVLLVEDNEVNIMYTRKILENWNCVPDEAKNGLIALEKLKEKDYDLILMDVRMPIMDGFEATKFIRANFKAPKSNTPIIALTANAIKGDDEKCIEAGMNDYISKPFQPETLKNKIIGNINLESFTKQVMDGPTKVIDPDKTVDLTYLKQMSDNDINFITDMVKSFMSQSPKEIENIWIHYAKNETDEIANLIHKIKPSITFMGIHALKDLVLEIEENAKQKKLDLLKDQLKTFENICKAAIEELKEEFGSLA
jgi:PAS domain S-box-containing protein